MSISPVSTTPYSGNVQNTQPNNGATPASNQTSTQGTHKGHGHHRHSESEGTAPAAAESSETGTSTSGSTVNVVG